MSGFIETVQGPPFEGVAAGGRAVCRLPIGPEYHDILLNFGGTVTVAQVERVVVRANARIILDLTGTQIDLINQHDGLTAYGSPQKLRLPFNRHKLLQRVANEVSSLRTGAPPGVGENPDVYVSQLSLEVDIAAAATTPTLSCTLLQSQADWSVPRAFRHRLKSTYNAAGAGEFVISDLPRGGRALQSIDRIFVFHAGDVESVEVVQNRSQRFKRLEAENTRFLNDGIKVDQSASNVFAIDFTEQGMGANGLPVRAADDLQVKITTGDADPLVLVTDYFGDALV